MIDVEVIELVNKTLELVDVNEDHIADMIKSNPTRALHEFKKLQISAPRGLGLTSAASQLTMQYPKSLLICPNDRVENDVIRQWNLKSFANVYSFSKVQQSNLGFGSMDLLIFDPWTSFEKDMRLKHDVYEYIYRVMNNVKLFVMLG